ncbi:MAG: SMI1/KNR4 family protein [Thermoguttaceae bacterium]|nr:SMI1/KNR4 family protein [Thermoguttaceae bacterium]
MKYSFETLKKLVDLNPWFLTLTEMYYPTPTEEAIAKAEEMLGLKFPADYRKFLATWGYLGIPDGGAEVCGIIRNDPAIAEYPNVVFFTQDAREASELPPYYIAIFDADGDETLCIDSRTADGAVVSWDNFEHEVAEEISDSFVDYLIDDTVEHADIIEEDGYKIVWPDEIEI